MPLSKRISIPGEACLAPTKYMDISPTNHPVASPVIPSIPGEACLAPTKYMGITTTNHPVVSTTNHPEAYTTNYPEAYTTNHPEAGPVRTNHHEKKDQTIIPVTGRSMMPYLKPGRDVVLLTAVDPAEIKPGDIIYAYQATEQRHILHRVIRHSPETRSITLMGDGNLKMTEQIPYGNILGRVALIDRQGRKKPFPPSKARLWRLLKPIRRILLKII